MEYDVRYPTSPIAESDFRQAGRATRPPAPGNPGSHETMEVGGLAAATTYFFAVKALDEWGNPGPLGGTASGTTLPPPTFDSTPASFSADLRTGDTTTRTLLIRNAGEGTLDWTIPPPAISGPGGVAQSVAAGAPATVRGATSIGAGTRRESSLVGGAGGPDAFGYRSI